MESNTALIHAASGLVPSMSAKQTGIIKQSFTAQISASLYYQAQVMANLTKSKAVANKFQKVVYDAVVDDFGMYMDAMARSKPKQFHHVYEWNQLGSENGRLFKLNRIPSQGLVLSLDYSFKLSKTKVPNKFKKSFVFANKAYVMENGTTVIIAPKKAERLVFESKAGYTVFMPKGKSVTVQNPGGRAVQQSFSMAYKKYFTGQLVNNAIRTGGVARILGADIAKSLRLPGQVKKIKYTFSPNSLKSEAESRIAEVFSEGLNG